MHLHLVYHAVCMQMLEEWGVLFKGLQHISRVCGLG